MPFESRHTLETQGIKADYIPAVGSDIAESSVKRGAKLEIAIAVKGLAENDLRAF